jgi:hypothetical protein
MFRCLVAVLERLARSYQCLGWRWQRARVPLAWADVYVAQEEPRDQQRAMELLRESQTMFEGMGISRFGCGGGMPTGLGART